MKDISTADTYAGLPAGYAATEQGVCLYGEDESGDFVPGPWLCTPIRVIGTGCRENGTDWGRVVELTDPKGMTHVVCLFNACSASTAVRMLKSRGLKLNSEIPHAEKKLSTLLQNWEVEAQYLFVDRLGWADTECTTFVFDPNKTIGQKQVLVIGETGNELRRQQISDLSNWKASVATRCAGNPILVFSVAAALAAPFIQLLNRDSFTVHLRGRSSAGKTTALRVANSVWNSPSGIQSWRTTSNALETVAVTANSTLLTLDELGQVSGLDADAASYMLGNERGKRRARSDGSGAPCASWKLIALSSGEISLAEKIAEAGKKTKTGQQVRFLDIEADGFQHGVFAELHGATSGKELSDDLSSAVASAHGTAGYEMVQWITRDSERAKNTVLKISSSIEKALSDQAKGPLDAAAARVAKNMSLIVAAGEIASRIGIVDWRKGHTLDAGAAIFAKWLSTRCRPTVEYACEVFDFLDGNSSKLQVLGGTDMTDRVGFQDGDHYYLSPSIWSRIFSADHASKASKELSNFGLLIREGEHMATKMPRSVPNRERHYKLSKKMLSDVARLNGRAPRGTQDT